MTYERTLIHLGTDEEGSRRKAALVALADQLDAIGQRGPSISVLLQMIADGELVVKKP